MGKATDAGRAGRKPAKRMPVYTKWSRTFLQRLAETSNVAASARSAGIATSTAYDAKRSKPEFNRAWRQALCDGYELLEMELLQRLRAGQVKGADGKGPARAFENPIAFRLLVAHRAEAARQRAVRDNEDADAILASIDAKLDKMRQNQFPPDDGNGDADAEFDAE